MIQFNSNGMCLLSRLFTGKYTTDGSQELFYYLDQRPNNVFRSIQDLDHSYTNVSELYSKLPEKSLFFKDLLASSKDTEGLELLLSPSLDPRSQSDLSKAEKATEIKKSVETQVKKNESERIKSLNDLKSKKFQEREFSSYEEKFKLLDEFIKNTLNLSKITTVDSSAIRGIYEELEITNVLLSQYSSAYPESTPFLTSVFANLWHSMKGFESEAAIFAKLTEQFSAILNSIDIIVGTFNIKEELKYKEEDYKNASKSIDEFHKTLISGIEFSAVIEVLSKIENSREYYSHLILHLNLLKNLLGLLASIHKTGINISSINELSLVETAFLQIMSRVFQEPAQSWFQKPKIFGGSQNQPQITETKFEYTEFMKAVLTNAKPITDASKAKTLTLDKSIVSFNQAVFNALLNQPVGDFVKFLDRDSPDFKKIIDEKNSIQVLKYIKELLNSEVSTDIIETQNDVLQLGSRLYFPRVEEKKYIIHSMAYIADFKLLIDNLKKFYETNKNPQDEIKELQDVTENMKDLTDALTSFSKLFGNIFDGSYAILLLVKSLHVNIALLGQAVSFDPLLSNFLTVIKQIKTNTSTLSKTIENPESTQSVIFSEEQLKNSLKIAKDQVLDKDKLNSKISKSTEKEFKNFTTGFQRLFVNLIMKNPLNTFEAKVMDKVIIELLVFYKIHALMYNLSLQNVIDSSAEIEISSVKIKDKEKFENEFEKFKAEIIKAPEKLFVGVKKLKLSNFLTEIASDLKRLTYKRKGLTIEKLIKGRMIAHDSKVQQDILTAISSRFDVLTFKIQKFENLATSEGKSMSLLKTGIESEMIKEEETKKSFKGYLEYQADALHLIAMPLAKDIQVLKEYLAFSSTLSNKITNVANELNSQSYETEKKEFEKKFEGLKSKLLKSQTDLIQILKDLMKETIKSESLRNSNIDVLMTHSFYYSLSAIYYSDLIQVIVSDVSKIEEEWKTAEKLIKESKSKFELLQKLRGLLTEIRAKTDVLKDLKSTVDSLNDTYSQGGLSAKLTKSFSKAENEQIINDMKELTQRKTELEKVIKRLESIIIDPKFETQARKEEDDRIKFEASEPGKLNSFIGNVEKGINELKPFDILKIMNTEDFKNKVQLLLKSGSIASSRLLIYLLVLVLIFIDALLVLYICYEKFYKNQNQEQEKINSPEIKQ